MNDGGRIAPSAVDRNAIPPYFSGSVSACIVS
jgi:hypothetical protein